MEPITGDTDNYMYQNVLQTMSAIAKLLESGASKGTQRVRHREDEAFEITVLDLTNERNPLQNKIAKAVAFEEYGKDGNRLKHNN